MILNRADLLRELIAMHTYCRPENTRTEFEFVREYILPLNPTIDTGGNYHVVVGDSPILFSCHTDTVHRRAGRQTVAIDPVSGFLSLTGYSAHRSSCLGADDTVGVFLCRRMILAGIPGRYVFHNAEEIGCEGSRRLADDWPELLVNYHAAIAFDRGGTADVITHQMGRRTASERFARDLAAVLEETGDGLHYAPSDRGVYTDSESYADLIPECTNISVGYYRQHASAEYVDTDHVLRLLSALCRIDFANLTIDRVPGGSDLYDWPEEDTTPELTGILDEDDISDRDDPVDWYLNVDWTLVQDAIRRGEF